MKKTTNDTFIPYYVNEHHMHYPDHMVNMHDESTCKKLIN